MPYKTKRKGRDVYDHPVNRLNLAILVALIKGIGWLIIAPIKWAIKKFRKDDNKFQ